MRDGFITNNARMVAVPRNWKGKVSTNQKRRSCRRKSSASVSRHPRHRVSCGWCRGQPGSWGRWTASSERWNLFAGPSCWIPCPGNLSIPQVHLQSSSHSQTAVLNVWNNESETKLILIWLIRLLSNHHASVWRYSSFTSSMWGPIELVMWDRYILLLKNIKLGLTRS